MILVSTHRSAGKPKKNEEDPRKPSISSSRASGSPRSCLADCNSLGGRLGGRKPNVAVKAQNAKNEKNNLSSVRTLATSPDGSGGFGVLISHEVSLSDVSDSDDTPHCHRKVFSHHGPHVTASEDPSLKGHANKATSGHENGLPYTLSHLRSPTGPAAALSNRVIITARRRRTQQMPRNVTISALPAAALPLPLPGLPGKPESSSATRTCSRTVGLSSEAAFTEAGCQRSHSAGRPSPASQDNDNSERKQLSAASARKVLVIVAVTVAVAAAVAVATGGLFLAALRSLQYAKGANGAMPLTARWLGPAGGFHRYASVAISAATPRTRVITAATPSPDSDRRRSGSSSVSAGSSSVRGLMRWWFGWTAPVASGIPPRGGSGSSSGSPSTSTAIVPGASPGAGLNQSSATPPHYHTNWEWRESATVRVVTLVPADTPSPYGTSWEQLADHTAQRFEWTDSTFQMMVFKADQLGEDEGMQGAFLEALERGAQVVVGLQVANPGAEAFLRDPRVASRLPHVVVMLGGSEALSHHLTKLQGGLRPQDAGSWRTALARRLPWTPDGRGLELWDTLQLLLGRHDSDNFLFLFLVLVNQYVTTVRQVAETTKGFDLQSLVCMIKHCGSKVVGCVQDPTCKSALDCLQTCTFNDQMCQYRCIVSYESPLLEQFSLCILQLHNCRNLNAKPPLLPDPPPITAFRGVPLTHEAAEKLLYGWLDEPGQGAPASSLLSGRPGKPFSWLVAAGKNPAYDYFPCQHQLFYRGRGRGQVWYEPVFKAITLGGQEVWRRRVYRVRRGKVPGTFHLSVLDNGVTSNEFWRILDCHEHLDYCLFYYSGAASAAGLSYSGAILATPDGRMPGLQHLGRQHAALRRAGIEPWELSYVDNSNCEGAPLGITGPVAMPAAAAT